MSQAPDNNRAELEAEACYFSARVLEIEAHAIAMHAPVDSPEPEYLRALDLGGHDMRNLAPPTTLANLYQYPVDWRDVRQRSTCGLPNLWVANALFHHSSQWFRQSALLKQRTWKSLAWPSVVAQIRSEDWRGSRRGRRGAYVAGEEFVMALCTKDSQIHFKQETNGRRGDYKRMCHYNDSEVADISAKVLALRFKDLLVPKLPQFMQRRYGVLCTCAQCIERESDWVERQISLYTEWRGLKKQEQLGDGGLVERSESPPPPPPALTTLQAKGKKLHCTSKTPLLSTQYVAKVEDHQETHEGGEPRKNNLQHQKSNPATGNSQFTSSTQDEVPHVVDKIDNESEEL
ncbi:hypothetical protein Q9189_006521 [Teloschistes chrysophthalmus]